MNFRKFLEYGTQGQGPGASGARGAPAISAVKPATPKQSQSSKPGDLLNQAKQDSGLKGAKKIPPSPINPVGIGTFIPQLKPGISGGMKKPGFPSPSPMSPPVAWKPPNFSPFAGSGKTPSRGPGLFRSLKPPK